MKIVFVCYGNICRSPLAEALFRRAVARHPSLADVECASAGVAALEGNRATALACEVAAEIGIDLSAHRARTLRERLGGDLVLAMDRESLSIARECGLPAPVELLGDYAGTGASIDDPYGGTRDEYRRCLDQIAVLIEATVARLAREREAARPADPSAGPKA